MVIIMYRGDHSVLHCLKTFLKLMLQLHASNHHHMPHISFNLAFLQAHDGIVQRKLSLSERKCTKRRKLLQFR